MNIKFLMQYITHPRSTGAILPSSKKLSKKMIEEVNFSKCKCKCIVELGPGTGVFTEELLKRKKEDTKIILIENNETFYNILKDKYGNIKNVHIINDSAEKIDYYIRKHNVINVDYILSGLPFASLPREVSETILDKSKNVLGNKGEFITFQYTKLKLSLINEYFKNIKIKRELLNIPPAYVLNCTNKF